VIGYVHELKQRLIEMDDYYKKKLLEVNPEEKVFVKVMQKCREIEELRN
jgi:hypothetical protein